MFVNLALFQMPTNATRITADANKIAVIWPEVTSAAVGWDTLLTPQIALPVKVSYLITPFNLFSY